MDPLEQLSAKRLGIALAAAAFMAFAAQASRYPLAWYKRWRYPPQGPASSLGQDILADNEKREAGRVEARFRRLQALFAQAQAEGYDTRGLKLKAQAAMGLNVKAYRRQAVRLLTEVELAMPRQREHYLLMGPTQAPWEEVEPVVTAKRAAVAPIKKAGKRQRR